MPKASLPLKTWAGGQIQEIYTAESDVIVPENENIFDHKEKLEEESVSQISLDLFYSFNALSVLKLFDQETFLFCS